MIKVSHAVKTFGNKKALDGISFTAEEGRFIGLLGTNGAGKSTMLKAMAGLLRLDQGSVTIDEKSPCLSTRAMIAYLPDVDVWYPWMKLCDATRYMKDIYWDWDDKKARHLLDFLELEEDTLIQQASRGTRAKMKLLLALSRQAKYLLLDEPFLESILLQDRRLLKPLLRILWKRGKPSSSQHMKYRKLRTCWMISSLYTMGICCSRVMLKH
ncbi:Lipopolysaccharide export system ATP-binding protein LptB [compost metagenome]